MSGSFAPAPVTPAAQPIGGGMQSSPLAAALMGRGAQMPQMQSPLSGIPLSSLELLLRGQSGQPGQFDSHVSPMSQITNGVGNLFSGYQWNGMPGQGMMNDLSGQAAGNIAGGVAGL